MIDHEILNAACAKALASAPAWGTDDCCTFACDILEAQFGIDVMAPLRGKYASEAEAREVMWRYASGGLGETAVKLARRAALMTCAYPFKDAHVGVIAGEAGPALAVSDGMAWVARTDGVIRVPLWRAVLAWRMD